MIKARPQGVFNVNEPSVGRGAGALVTVGAGSVLSDSPRALPKLASAC